MLRRFDFSLGLNGHKPLATRLTYGDVAGFAQNVLRFAVAHPTKFRQFDASVLIVRLEALRDTKTLSLALLFELGETGTFLKTVCVGSLKIFEGLLQCLRTKRHDPANCRSLRSCSPFGINWNLNACRLNTTPL